MTPLRHVPCAECRSAHYHCLACDPHSACQHSLMAVRLGLPPERFPALGAAPASVRLWTVVAVDSPYLVCGYYAAECEDGRARAFTSGAGLN